MDLRELNAENPALYREAKSAIMGDDEPAPKEGLDETSIVKDNEEVKPAGGSEEHAESPSELETPATPGPEQTETSPPPRFAFAGREFDTQEEAERSYKEQQAGATRLAQELAELKRAQTQKQETQRYLAPVDELSREEYARIEQEAKRYGTDVETYRAIKAMRAEERAAEDQEFLGKAVESHISGHAQFAQDREFVRAAIENDPYLLMVPDGISVQEQERILRRRLDQVFSEAAKERTQRDSAARDEAVRKATIAETEKKQALARQAASTEAGSSKAAAPSSKPVSPGDAGDELIGLFNQRRAKLSMK